MNAFVEDLVSLLFPVEACYADGAVRRRRSRKSLIGAVPLRGEMLFEAVVRV